MLPEGQIFRIEEATVDEVAERHERAAIADFLHHLGGEDVDFGVGQFTVVIPGVGDARGRFERAGELGQHGAAGGRAVGQGLAAHTGEHGLPGILRRGVHVEAAVVEGITREVGRVREFIGRGEGPVGHRRLGVWLEDDPLIGQRVIARFQGFLDRLERGLIEGAAVAGGLLEGILLIRGDVGAGREIRSGREHVLFAGERVGGRLQVQAAEVISVPEGKVGGEGVVGAHMREVSDDARAFMDANVTVFRDGFVVANLGFGAWPVGDLGQVHDAGVGEGRTDGEVGVGVDLGRSRGAELCQREQRSARNRKEDGVATLCGRWADAVPPVGVLVVAREGNLGLGVQAALGEYPADGRVGLAVITEEVGLLRAHAQEVGRHRGGVDFCRRLQLGDPATG